MQRQSGLLWDWRVPFPLPDRRPLRLFGLFVLTSVAVREMMFWRHSGRDPFAPDYSAGWVEELVQRAGHGDLPVAVGQSLTYASLAYYSPPRFANRLVYLVDKGKNLDYGGTDALAKAGPSLSEFFPHQVVDYSEFAAAHREFLLYSEGCRHMAGPLEPRSFLDAVAGNGGGSPGIPGQNEGELSSLRVPTARLQRGRAARGFVEVFFIRGWEITLK